MVNESTNRQHERGVKHEINQYRGQGLAGLRESIGASEESWPYLVSAAIGMAGIGVASLVGAAELVVGVAVAYVAYDVIARGIPLWEALRELRHGVADTHDVGIDRGQN